MFTLGFKHKHKDTMILRTSLLFLAFMAATSLASNEKQTYIIHMDKDKTAATSNSPGNAKKWYESLIDSITKLSSQQEEDEGNEEKTPFPQLLYIYETAISGFAARLSKNQLDSFKKVDGFLSATPDEILGVHTTHTPQFLGLKDGRGLWSNSARKSVSNVIIGIVDTGIWPEHVSFQDLNSMPPVPSHWKGRCDQKGTNFSSSNCNKKLIGARAFFKGYEAFAGRINETLDYRSPRDSQGHGTHTASTAGGNVINGASMFGLAKGKASGMSYAARIAAYKACWQFGCVSSDILAAIDQAVADGVDVLSLSIGGLSKPFYSDNFAIASFGAIQKGVFVSCSAGNSGPSSSTVANTAPWMMTVAASYTDRTFPTSVKLGNGETFIGASLYSGKPKTKQLPLVYGAKAGGKGAEFCTQGSLSSELVKGKIVVCERGIIGRAEKGEKVKMAGGVGMLLLNTENEGEELFADAHILPATSLGAIAAKSIKKYVSSAGKKATASIVFKGTKYGNPAPVMAAFSSRGPSSIEPNVIKPDVTAPGMNILAAWPPKTSPTRLKTDNRSVVFNIISGTSMSCPHVSGLAALLKSVHKNWSPAAIKSALMTTAYTDLDKKNAPISDAGSSKSASPFAFGSGHVDPGKASDPGLIYDLTGEDYLNYLCSLNYTTSQISLLSRRNFTCPHNSLLQPGDLNYPSFAVLFNTSAQNATRTYKRMVTNVGGAMDTYRVQVSMHDEISVIVEPKVLNFTKFGEKLGYKVSFSALKSGIPSSGSNSFGKLAWVSKNHRVTSPIAVTWV